MNTLNAYAENYSVMKSIPNLEVKAAIYCRLSKDDETEGESASIQNQKLLLEQYCNQQGWEIVAVYQDDGYTGLNMNRPDLQRMLRAIERKQIDVVVTKDLSRLGRNYLQTGQLLEEFFPKNQVRYISLNDGIDTEKGNTDIMPFKNILNEFYSRDVSKKVHSSYLVKARNGKFTGCLAPFGYKKSPEDKNRLIVDEETAWIVKKIYDYAKSGRGPNYIRTRLELEQIPTPAWWNRQKGLRNKKTKFEIANPETGHYVWDFTTIKEILSNPVYIGNTASQKSVYQFKTGWIKDKKADEWITVENTHEGIIDKADFEIVQSKIKNRQRPNSKGEYNMFAGLIVCGQCGHTLNIRTANSKTGEKIFTCSKYNHYGVTHCSQHKIKYTVLYEIILEQIRNYARLALENEKEVLSELSKSCAADDKSENEAILKSINADKERIAELEKLIASIYTDRINGRISENNFENILKQSQTEQETLNNRIKLNSERLAKAEQTETDGERWTALIKEYADIKELDTEILNRLIKKIVVQEDFENSVVKQTIEIHFNFMHKADKYKIVRQ